MWASYPTRPEAAPIASALGTADMWWFCLLYSVTFGGFVGLGTFLPQFYHNQFGLPGVEAGYWAAGAAFIGSTLRPLGGYIADRLGGVRVISILLLLIAGTYALASLLLPIGFTGALFIVGIAFMGMGNGAVFQLVPQRFHRTIGVATGLVGALGGIGGFVLPFLLGSIKQTSGSYAAGWIILAIFAFVVLAVLRLLTTFRAGWRSSWFVEAEGTEIYPQASRA